MSAKQFTRLLLFATLLCCQTRVSNAQQGTTYVEHHHSSTLEESLLYGSGFMVRNLGAGQRDMAEGQKALAEAQQKYLENRRTALYHRVELQRLNADQKAAKREKPSTAEDLARRAQAMAPKRLSSAELASDGTVQWPVVLCDPRYDCVRNSLESVLKQLAVETDQRRTGLLQYSLATGCDELNRSLQGQITGLSANDYVAARKFLDSLRFEAQSRRAPTTAAMAMR